MRNKGGFEEDRDLQQYPKPSHLEHLLVIYIFMKFWPAISLITHGYSFIEANLGKHNLTQINQKLSKDNLFNTLPNISKRLAKTKLAHWGGRRI